MSSETATCGCGLSPVAASVYRRLFAASGSCCPSALHDSLRASAGSWVGDGAIPKACRCQHASAPWGATGSPRTCSAQGCLRHLPVPDGRWLAQADLLSLGRSPFPFCPLLTGIARFPELRLLEQDGEFCLQWARKSCLYPWCDGGEPWQGTAGRMLGDLPRAEECQGHLATPPPGCLHHA